MFFLKPNYPYRIFCVAMSLSLSACNSALPPSDPILDNTVEPDTFTFAEDEDAAYAALDYEQNRLLVQALPGADPQAVANAIAAADARIVDEIAEIDLNVLETQIDLTEAARRISESALFETFQKNYLYPPDLTANDPQYSRQQHLTQIRADKAWDITTGDASIVIAVVDTGVDPDQPDLKPKILGGRNIYDVNDNFDDVLGHGTMVAGTAAAITNNSVGVAGVSWQSPILAVRVGNAQGLATSQHVAAGILWAVANGAKIINVSFAPLWADKIVSSAAKQAFNRGTLVVVSAGNKGGLNKAAGFYEILFAGGVQPDNKIATFSDKGPFVDLVAPGTQIRTTGMDATYVMANGTSFSAPIVAGVIALAWSANPNLRPITVQEAVLSTTVDLGASGKDDTFGLGLVDAAAAVQKARQSFDPVDTTPPVVLVTSPATGQALSGRATVAVSATDKYGVADLVMSVDGVAFATDTRSPYSFVLDTAAFSAGSHDLSFVATDLSGNASAPKVIRVNFTASSGGNSAGTIRFTAPTAGALVSGDVTVKASLSDPDGLALIEWLVDGRSALVSTVSGRTSGVSFVWRSAGYAKGPHTITAVITDNLGNVTQGALGLTRK